jgi:Flp pilus assembly protein TadG
MIISIRRLCRDDRGEIEDLPQYAICFLAALMLVGVGILLGRAGNAQNVVQQAAYSAARDASLSRAGDAVPHAIDAANRSLGSNISCTALDVKITGNGLTTGLGEAGTVTATVACTVSYSDIFLGALPLPGSFTVTKSATSPVDPYRER